MSHAFILRFMFVIVTSVKLVSQILMMKWVKCNEFYLAHKWLT